MLLTPRIIRTHEYTARDLSPIYVGTNQNFGLTGPPPLIAAPPVEEPPPEAAPVPPAPGRRQTCRRTPAAERSANRRTRSGRDPGATATGRPAATCGNAARSGRAARRAADAACRPHTRRRRSRRRPRSQSRRPAGEVRVGAGPYMVPIYVTSVSRASNGDADGDVQPGHPSHENGAGGKLPATGRHANVVFTPNTDAGMGRVDLAFVRTGDSVGASGHRACWPRFSSTPLARAPRSSQSAASWPIPAGGLIPVQFVPASVVVR